MTVSLLPLPGGLTGPDAARMALDRLFRHVQTVFLSRQHPVTGLLPASTAVTVHGNYTHAWVRDNVYSVLAPWALALAYRRRGDNPGRARLLEQSVVKTMRGLLQAMMRQAAKVERFKDTQDPLDGLHALYSSSTGETVAPDDGWGHLQVDATSLYLLMMGQMTRSGLAILFTPDEVAFVQNLVHYIGPAYRIADYGIWERGRKINDGKVELNASSIGMAKAALEALQGLDMFGEDAGSPGPRTAVIQVVPDEVARARATLEALLPRESGSKEVDAALLSIIGFPAFAVEDPDLVRRTREEIRTKLEGRYGAKRFLRDGHQTAFEDHSRLHYESGELERFEGIESEWPVFFAYAFVTALMTGDRAEAERYRARLDALLVDRDGEPLLPELFVVPAEAAEAERAAPGSQDRVPNENVPLLWAQSLYIIGLLLEAGLISPADVDPLNRRGRVGLKPPVPVRMVVLAEDEAVRQALARFGLDAQTLEQVSPTRICHSEVLEKALAQVGACPALGLTGRPRRRLGSLITAQIFRLSGQTTVFVPAFFDRDGFYFSYDSRFVVERLLAEIAYINRAWTWPEAPVLVLPVTRGMIMAAEFAELARTLADLAQGRVPELAVRGASLGHCLVIGRTVSLDGVPGGDPMRPRPPALPCGPEMVLLDGPEMTAEERRDWACADTGELLRQLPGERALERRLDLLAILCDRLGRSFAFAGGAPLSELVERLYRTAGRAGRWGALRRAAALLDIHDERLQDAAKEMVVRQKRLLLGRGPHPDTVVDRPLDNGAIIARLHRSGNRGPVAAMLAEEMMLFAGQLLKSSPDLFRYCLTLRPVDMLGLLTRSLARERAVDPAAAEALLAEEGPHAILSRLRRLVAGCPGMTGEFCLPELSRVPADRPVFALASEAGGWAALSLADAGGWAVWRDVTGTFLPVPEDFYARVWTVLRHCDALVIADPAEPQHRLESATLRADSTPDERDFARGVEALLDRIAAPDYRQLTVEALWAVSEILRSRPGTTVVGALETDRLLADAVALHAAGLAAPVSEAEAWQAFYALSPPTAADRIGAAFLDRAACVPAAAQQVA